MDDDGLIFETLATLLTQVRSARRSLEEVERNTSRYLGFEFARAFSEGPRFGAPPMFQGALKVHVVNINDLAPGNSFGDLLMGIFGGIGNLVSGLIGGTVGSLLAAFNLPAMMEQLDRIVANARAIIERLGIGGPNPPTGSGNTTGSNAERQSQSGETLLTTLNGIGTFVRQLTALFQAGSTGSNADANQAGRTAPEVLTSSGERWMAILHGVNRLLDRLQHVVNGLIILIPMVVGSIALLIGNLANIRRAILQTIQFVLRNILVLRGVILTTIFETVSAAARLAASIVAMLGTAIQQVISSIVGVIGTIMDAAFDALSTLTTALQQVIRLLLQWLVNGVFNTLRAIGQLDLFRSVDHFVRMLPGLLEPMFMIVVAFKSSRSQGLPTDMGARLNRAFDASFPPPGPGGAPGTPADQINVPTSAEIIGDFPPLQDILDPLSATLGSALDATGAQITTATRETFDTVGGTLGQLAGRFDSAIESEATHSRDILARHAGELTRRADTLAETISAPMQAESGATGFELIADAYADWLTNGEGLQQILDLASEHFENPPASGEPGGNLGLLRGQFDRPSASVEIDRVEIIVEPAEDPTATESGIEDASLQGLLPQISDEEIWIAWHRHNTDLEERAIRPSDHRSVIT